MCVSRASREAEKVSLYYFFYFLVGYKPICFIIYPLYVYMAGVLNFSPLPVVAWKGVLPDCSTGAQAAIPQLAFFVFVFLLPCLLFYIVLLICFCVFPKGLQPFIYLYVLMSLVCTN